MTTFEELGVGDRICKAIANMGWKEPTPIQVQSIPVGLSGRDLFGQAQTGTGKTGAYSMIVIRRTKSKSKLPTTVVLTPTRELADQVSKEMRSISHYTGHEIVAIYGGASYDTQISKLQEGCDIVVGTPGRILDLQAKGILKLDNVKELVLDEADRMLDMGFVEDIQNIISMTPENRHTMMFSATLSDEVYGIASDSMRDPKDISVSHDEIVSDLVSQYYIETARSKKMDLLRDIMANGDPKMLVFCSTKLMVDSLYEGMSIEGIRIGAIHGDMPQARREKTINGFKNDRMNILVATDVAARGIDIDNIECVVNYDAPIDPETYTHRIGRTGRAGRHGVAITFVTPSEDRRIPSYEEFMGKSVERLTRKQIPGIRIADPELKALHPERKEPPKRECVRVSAKKEMPEVKKDMTVVSLDIGKTAGTDRNEIISYITSCANIQVDSIGRIGLSANSSFVEVESVLVNDVISSINRSRLNGKRVRASLAPEKTKCKDKLPKK